MAPLCLEGPSIVDQRLENAEVVRDTEAVSKEVVAPVPVDKPVEKPKGKAGEKPKEKVGEKPKADQRKTGKDKQVAGGSSKAGNQTGKGTGPSKTAPGSQKRRADGDAGKTLQKKARSDKAPLFNYAGPDDHVAKDRRACADLFREIAGATCSLPPAEEMEDENGYQVVTQLMAFTRIEI